MHDHNTGGRKRAVISLMLLIGLLFSVYLTINMLTLMSNQPLTFGMSLLIVIITLSPGIVSLHYLSESVLVWKNARTTSRVSDE